MPKGRNEILKTEIKSQMRTGHRDEGCLGSLGFPWRLTQTGGRSVMRLVLMVKEESDGEAGTDGGVLPGAEN